MAVLPPVPGPQWTDTQGNLTPAAQGWLVRLKAIATGTNTGGGGTGTPGGVNPQVQYNNNGVFGGSTMTFDNTVNAFSIGAAATGNTALVVNGVTGTHSTKIADSAAVPTPYNAGYLEMPLVVLPVTLNPTYTAQLSDAGKVLYYGQAALSNIIVYIPDPSLVTFPLGTSISIINDSPYNVIVEPPLTNPYGSLFLSLGIGISESPNIYPAGGVTLVLVTADGDVGRWFVNGQGYV